MATASAAKSPASKKEVILNDFLDAIIDGKEITSAQVARKRRVDVGSVRAYKANLTRGAYGTTKTLVNRRRKARQSS